MEINDSILENNDIIAEPLLEQHLKKIHIVTDNCNAECDFWIGVSKPGNLSVNDVLTYSDIRQVFTAAAINGLQNLRNAESLMISDSKNILSRSIYFLLLPFDLSVMTVATWIDSIIKTLNNWPHKKIGIYLAPKLINTDELYNLKLNLVLQVIKRTQCNNFYMISDKTGAVPLINELLDIKESLSNSDMCIEITH